MPERDEETTLTGRPHELLPIADTAALADAIVVVLHPPHINPGRRYPIGDSALVVGRRSDNDIPLDADSVSRRHARFVRRGDGYWVEDLSSTNGTFVNDIEVREHQLSDGDVVRFGAAFVKFLSGANVERAYHEEVYRISILDALTGIHNRRFFEEALEREVARALRRGHHTSLVYFDIDHFKRVNDERGHLAGDTVLQLLCRRLKTRIRREDVFARIGGEEFACVLSGTGFRGAMAFADDVRQLVAREPFIYEGLNIMVSISAGVASFEPEKEFSSTEDTAAGREISLQSRRLLRVADEKLYEAKRQGRNRIAG